MALVELGRVGRRWFCADGLLQHSHRHRHLECQRQLVQLCWWCCGRRRRRGQRLLQLLWLLWLLWWVAPAPPTAAEWPHHPRARYRCAVVAQHHRHTRGEGVHETRRFARAPISPKARHRAQTGEHERADLGVSHLPGGMRLLPGVPRVQVGRGCSLRKGASCFWRPRDVSECGGSCAPCVAASGGRRTEALFDRSDPAPVSQGGPKPPSSDRAIEREFGSGFWFTISAKPPNFDKNPHLTPGVCLVALWVVSEPIPPGHTCPGHIGSRQVAPVKFRFGRGAVYAASRA